MSAPGLDFRFARKENCFRCWHCRRVEGTNAFCVCMALVTKSNPPDLVMSPYSGRGGSFYDRQSQMGIWGGDLEGVKVPGFTYPKPKTVGDLAHGGDEETDDEECI